MNTETSSPLHKPHNQLQPVIFVFVFLILAFLAGCDMLSSDKEAQGEETPSLIDAAAQKQIVGRSNDFSFDLLEKISKADSDESFFLSPLSISFAFGMALNGADGATYEQMKAFFGYDGLSEEQINETFKHLIEWLSERDPHVQMEIANSVWYRDTFDVLYKFLDRNRAYFDADIEAIDFNDPEAPDIINAWISDKTNGLIDEMIEEIHPLVVLYLINAIYYKADWSIQFDPEKTRDAHFTTRDGSTTTVPMMQVSENFKHYVDDEWTIIDLPYGDGSFSFTAFLPAETSHRHIAEGLGKHRFDELIDQLEEDTVDVYIPRFEIDYEYETIKDDLIEMGLTLPFGENGFADFRRIHPIEDLVISNVMHQAVINVDEEGSEAAAVTVIEIIRTDAGGQPNRTVIRLDRPFLFFIREHESNTILFMGSYKGD